MTNNPARSRLVSKALPSKQLVERRTVRLGEVAEFLEACKSQRLGAYFYLLLFSGLRPEEALALQWSDVGDDSVTVRRVLVDGKHGIAPHFARPKTKKSARNVVLPSGVISVLRDHRKRQAADQIAAGPAWQSGGLVFCDEMGMPLRQDRTRRTFREILKAADLPHMRPYDLRHSAATLLLELGEDLKVVSERLGHSTIVLTADTYAHVTRGMQERAAARLKQLSG